MEDVKENIVLLPTKNTALAKRVCNGDLPKLWVENNGWRILISSLIRFLATTSNIFNVEDALLIRAITTLCGFYYGGVLDGGVITNTCPAFKLVSICSLSVVMLH